MEKNKQSKHYYYAKFKIDVILDIYNNKISQYQAIKKYWGVNTKQDIDKYKTTVSRWMKIYQKYGEAGFMNESGSNNYLANEEEISDFSNITKEELIEKYKNLKVEIAYLKKLDALVLTNEKEQKNNAK